jgi:hypothetical protein
MKDIPKKYLVVLIIALCLFRIAYGVVSEFWAEDEQQIYLIGLKSFTTGTWPYYGPDVVYTKTQIPGALQGLLVSVAFYILPIPEAPAMILSLLSLAVLSFFANYLCKRFTDFPKWIIWTLTLTTPWIMQFSTRVVNPSYVVIFSIPFFLCFIEVMDFYKEALIKKGISFFVFGLAITCIMQIHLSWVLLLPFAGFAFLHVLRKDKKSLFKYVLYFTIGAAIGLSTLLPTILHPDTSGAGKVDSNLVFQVKNFANAIPILTKFLSFAAYEIPYMMGGDTKQRLQLVEDHIWISPFAAYLYIFGMAQVGLFIIGFFQKNEDSSWKKIKWMMVGTYILLFCSFFFSIKGPSPHTFFLLFPLSLIYSFYCYRWLFAKKKIWAQLFMAAVLSGVIFQVGLGIESYQKKSVYLNRAKAQEAIDKKDYKILGLRRSDHWGYGY